MALRAWFIRKLGAATGHPVLDIHALAAQLEDGLRLSIGEASALASAW